MPDRGCHPCHRCPRTVEDKESIEIAAALVAGRNRVPRPAAGMTAFRTAACIVDLRGIVTVQVIGKIINFLKSADPKLFTRKKTTNISSVPPQHQQSNDHGRRDLDALLVKSDDSGYQPNRDGERSYGRRLCELDHDGPRQNQRERYQGK